jgi:hypothetical protein
MTTNNKIELFQNNSVKLDCSVYGISDVSNYIPYLTVKKNPIDISPILFNTGIVSDSSGKVSFTISSSDTSITCGDYVYDITIESSTHIYTVVKDKFVVVDSVRY